MRISRKYSLGIVSFLMLLSMVLPMAGVGAAPQAQATTSNAAAVAAPYYFAETGHYLSGRFREYWEANGGLFVFGFPLTKVYDEVSTDGGNTYTVQYFERGRWEAHPEIADPKFKVLLGLMGLERMNRIGVPDFARAAETSAPTGADIPGGSGGPYRAGHIEYGFNTYLIGNFAGINYNNQVLGKVREAGFGWVRIQLVWKDFEESRGQYHWEILDAPIAAANANGVKVLVSVVKSPDWASPSRHGGLPEDLDAFYNLMRVVSGRYAGKVQAYEIWNEQNLAGEVGGNVQIAPYYETLKAGFLGVRKNDGNAAVLFGGLTPTGVNNPSIAINDVEYLKQFYAYAGGAGKQYYDHLAAHPGSAANAPDLTFPGNPGPGTCGPTAKQRYGAADGTCYNSAPDFYFRRIAEQRAVMEQNGESGKQVWLTEFGWDSCQGQPVPNGYEYCELTSEQQQAQYIVRAFEIGKNEWPWMGVMMLWNLNYQAIPGIAAGDEKYSWGVLRPDFSSRPAYDAIKNMPK